MTTTTKATITARIRNLMLQSHDLRAKGLIPIAEELERAAARLRRQRAAR